MKSIARLVDQSAALPVLADDLIEFHAARLLLLFRICGQADKITGLTKMAKLDFFVRYPQFFDQAAAYLGSEDKSSLHRTESSMIRFHYGPWDHRYYQVLAYLEGKGLVSVDKQGKAFVFSLTGLGHNVADQIGGHKQYQTLRMQMKRVKKVLGEYSGSRLKRLVYELFEQEVAAKSMGQVIE